MPAWKHISILSISALLVLVSCGLDNELNGSKPLFEKKRKHRIIEDQDVKPLPPEKPEGFLATEKRIFILIQGGGPEFVVNMSGLAKQIARDHEQPGTVYEVGYGFRDKMEVAADKVASDIHNILRQYPEDQKVDIIAHSIGDFIGLYALTRGQLIHRVENYISLAGVKIGQDKRLNNCWFNCPDMIKRMRPANNDFVEDFFYDWGSELQQMKHCALYSAADNRVDSPREAGVFPGLPETGHLVFDISHLGFASDKRVYPLIKEHCYE